MCTPFYSFLTCRLSTLQATKDLPMSLQGRKHLTNPFSRILLFILYHMYLPHTTVGTGDTEAALLTHGEYGFPSAAQPGTSLLEKK